MVLGRGRGRSSPVIIPKNLAENWLYDINDVIGIVANNYVKLERKKCEITNHYQDI